MDIIYKPKAVTELPGFVWQCAYPDAIGSHILAKQIYDRIYDVNYRESNYHMGKWFKQEENAMKALNNAFDRLAKDIELYYRNLPRDKQLDLFPKLEAIYKTGDFIWRK